MPRSFSGVLFFCRVRRISRTLNNPVSNREPEQPPTIACLVKTTGWQLFHAETRKNVLNEEIEPLAGSIRIWMDSGGFPPHAPAAVGGPGLASPAPGPFPRRHMSERWVLGRSWTWRAHRSIAGAMRVPFKPTHRVKRSRPSPLAIRASACSEQRAFRPLAIRDRRRVLTAGDGLGFNKFVRGHWFPMTRPTPGRGETAQRARCRRTAGSDIG